MIEQRFDVPQDLEAFVVALLDSQTNKTTIQKIKPTQQRLILRFLRIQAHIVGAEAELDEGTANEVDCLLDQITFAIEKI